MQDFFIDKLSVETFHHNSQGVGYSIGLFGRCIFNMLHINICHFSENRYELRKYVGNVLKSLKITPTTAANVIAYALLRRRLQAKFLQLYCVE